MFVEHKEAVEVTEAPAKTLKLSEAIRIGCMKSRPTKEIEYKAWATWRGGKCFTCAVGALWLGLSGGGREEFYGFSERMPIHLENLYQVPPRLVTEISGRYEALGHSREQIADWLESQGY